MNDIYAKHIEGYDVPGKPLGRHVAHDPRSRNFEAEQAPKITSVIHQSHGLPLTQTRGSCTAEALCGALDSDPDFKTKQYEQSDADHLYDEEIKLEGGDPAVDDPGGTGLYVCQAAKSLGWITGYTHTFSLNGALKALTLKPVITGVNWYDSFDTPRADGLVTIGRYATVRGGHEFVLDEIDAAKHLIGAWNSWGDQWGLKGKFYMRWTTFERLLHEEGDVTVPVP